MSEFLGPNSKDDSNQVLSFVTVAVPLLYVRCMSINQNKQTKEGNLEGFFLPLGGKSHRRLGSPRGLNFKSLPHKQYSGSRSRSGDESFWASRILNRNYLYGSGSVPILILPSTSKQIVKTTWVPVLWLKSNKLLSLKTELNQKVTDPAHC